MLPDGVCGSEYARLHQLVKLPFGPVALWSNGTANVLESRIPVGGARAGCVARKRFIRASPGPIGILRPLGYRLANCAKRRAFTARAAPSHRAGAAMFPFRRACLRPSRRTPTIRFSRPRRRSGRPLLPASAPATKSRRAADGGMFILSLRPGSLLLRFRANGRPTPLALPRRKWWTDKGS